MNILVACEESQAVTKELRRLGHSAFSCDIQPCSGGHPEWHICYDATELIKDEAHIFYTCDGCGHVVRRWDGILAFPPCTHLAVSGAGSFEKKRNDGRQRRAIEFFYKFVNCECPRVAIENPVNIIGGDYINMWFGYEPLKPTQRIQPWMFGDKVGKTTCLWLKGLPPLVAEVTEKPEPDFVYFTDRNGKVTRQERWYYETRCLPHAERGKAASKTFPGVARAMAEQWFGKCEKHDNN